jgi:hypothetical protein
MEKTLTQIGQDLSAAAQTLSWQQRKEMGAALWESLRKPVGTLRRKK